MPFFFFNIHIKKQKGMTRNANWGDSLIKCMEKQLYLKGIGKCKKRQVSFLTEVKIKFLRIEDQDTKNVQH